jgi:putative methyltransferase
VRVNFAKSSNDRVFDISALWARHDMLMGTTLSMQSTDMAVLEAIDRANIGLDNYRALKDRYARDRIHTYTELILGLPRETRRSFEGGIGSLLEAGNHEDIRVYEFTLLPNAPINTPERRAAYALRTIPKRLYVQPPDTEPDEIETTELVVETEAMSSDDWVACALFSTMVQTLHNGCWTRYLSIYLRREHDLPYADFYAGLIDAFLDRPDTALGAVLERLRALYRRYQRDPAIPQANLVASQPDMVEAMQPYGRRRGWAADEWAWLRLSEERDRLYEELAEHVRPLAADDGDALDDVLRFQSEIVLAPDYDPRRGKRCEFRFDLPAYFEGTPLRRVDTVVELLDERMGVNRQYPLVASDLRRFAKAAVGESYPFSRIRHYQHQLSAARIERRPVAAHA